MEAEIALMKETRSLKKKLERAQEDLTISETAKDEAIDSSNALREKLEVTGEELKKEK